VGKGGGGGGRGNVREYLSDRLDERGDMFVGELVFRVGEIGGNVEFSDARGGRAEVEYPLSDFRSSGEVVDRDAGFENLVCILGLG
jgi:hypothetical protein